MTKAECFKEDWTWRYAFILKTDVCSESVALVKSVKLKCYCETSHNQFRLMSFIYSHELNQWLSIECWLLAPFSHVSCLFRNFFKQWISWIYIYICICSWKIFTEYRCYSRIKVVLFHADCLSVPMFNRIPNCLHSHMEPWSHSSVRIMRMMRKWTSSLIKCKFYI